MFRLVEEDELRRLIESDMIYNELCDQGIENLMGDNFVHFPDINDIEKELKKYDKFEERDSDD